MKASWPCLLALCAFSLTPGRAAVPEPQSFSETLSAEQRTTTGISRLTEAERTALDAAIRKEIALAVAGDVYAFKSTFTGRRTASELEQFGLNRLSDQEKAQLNERVAAAIADRPASVVRARPISSASGVTSYTPGPVVHGAVTVAYVWDSHGGSGFGAAVDVVQTWPSGRSLAVSVSDFHGDGFVARNMGLSHCWRR